MKSSFFDTIMKILVIPELVIIGYLVIFWLLPFMVSVSVAFVVSAGL